MTTSKSLIIQGFLCYVRLRYDDDGFSYEVYRGNHPICTGWSAGTNDEAFQEAIQHATSMMSKTNHFFEGERDMAKTKDTRELKVDLTLPELEECRYVVGLGNQVQCGKLLKAIEDAIAGSEKKSEEPEEEKVEKKPVATAAGPKH